MPSLPRRPVIKLPSLRLSTYQVLVNNFITIYKSIFKAPKPVGQKEASRLRAPTATFSGTWWIASLNISTDLSGTVQGWSVDGTGACSYKPAKS